MIGKLVWPVLAVLSTVAALMLLNFWREWQSTPVVPHAEYQATGEDWPRPPDADTSCSMSAPCTLATATGARSVQLWSDDFSTATIEVQARASTKAPWTSLLMVLNPDKDGQLWSIPTDHMEVRAVTTSYTAGALHAKFQGGGS